MSSLCSLYTPSTITPNFNFTPLTRKFDVSQRGRYSRLPPRNSHKNSFPIHLQPQWQVVFRDELPAADGLQSFTLGRKVVVHLLPLEDHPQVIHGEDAGEETAQQRKKFKEIHDFSAKYSVRHFCAIAS